jgi:hypothetical protein
MKCNVKRIGNSIHKLSIGGIVSNAASMGSVGAGLGGPWGAIAGATIGVGMGIVEGQAEQEEEKRFLEEQEKTKRLNMANRDMAYNKQGYNKFSYFDKGGTPKED